MSEMLREIDQPHPFMVYSPSELRGLPDESWRHLIGKGHLSTGVMTVIAGPGGCGKSRLITALARCGATGEDFIGLPVHKCFKTFILQNENPIFRLQEDFEPLVGKHFDQSIRVSSIPNGGIQLADKVFKKHLAEEIKLFEPDVFVLDPWTSTIRDHTFESCVEALYNLQVAIPYNELAVVVAAHTRKKDLKHGTNSQITQDEVLGSSRLVTTARCVLLMQPVNNSEETRHSVKIDCVKNNNGEKGPIGVWKQNNGYYQRVDEAATTNRGRNGNPKIELDDIAEVFEQGNKSLTKAQAKFAIMELTGVKVAAAYNALNLKDPTKNRFAKYLRVDEQGHYHFIADP
ncbi:MAG: AAA family ATPase [Verrucomicrobiota bacterium]